MLLPYIISMISPCFRTLCQHQNMTTLHEHVNMELCLVRRPVLIFISQPKYSRAFDWQPRHVGVNGRILFRDALCKVGPVGTYTPPPIGYSPSLSLVLTALYSTSIMIISKIDNKNLNRLISMQPRHQSYFRPDLVTYMISNTDGYPSLKLENYTVYYVIEDKGQPWKLSLDLAAASLVAPRASHHRLGTMATDRGRSAQWRPNPLSAVLSS